MCAIVGSCHAGLHRIGVGFDDHPHREAECACEVEVALIVRRDSHDRTGAVVRKHVIRGVDRQPFAVHGIDRVALQENTGFRSISSEALDIGGLLHLVEVGVEFGFGGGAGSKFGGEIGVGSDDEERRTEQRVRTRRVHGNRGFTTFDGERHLCTGGAADPVALHEQNLLGPVALELLHVVEQPIRVLRDAQVPLRELLLRDNGVAALAQALHDLLVREHRLTRRTPVHGRCLAVRESALVHLEEEPLVPVVVLRITGVEHPIPVERTGVPAH